MSIQPTAAYQISISIKILTPPFVRVFTEYIAPQNKEGAGKMSAGHEHYLQTEGRFSLGWLEPVDNGIEGMKVWRFPYILNFNGQTYSRVLEVSEKVDSEAAAFVGRLATGWFVSVAPQENGYSILLAKEQSGTAAKDAATVIAEAEHITQIAVPQPQEQLVAA